MGTSTPPTPSITTQSLLKLLGELIRPSSISVPAQRAARSGDTGGTNLYTSSMVRSVPMPASRIRPGNEEMIPQPRLSRTVHRQAKVLPATIFTSTYVVLRELSGRDSIRFEGAQCSVAHLFGDFRP